MPLFRVLFEYSVCVLHGMDDFSSHDANDGVVHLPGYAFDIPQGAGNQGTLHVVAANNNKGLTACQVASNPNRSATVAVTKDPSSGEIKCAVQNSL